MQNFSDENLKRNISNVGDTLENVIKLVTKYYKWIETAPQYNLEKTFETYIGLIAQEVQELFPELISDYKIGDETYLRIDYGALAAVLVESIKTLNTLLLEQKDINDKFLQLHNDQKTFNQTIINNMNLINAAIPAGSSATITPPTNINPNITNIEPPEA